MIRVLLDQGLPRTAADRLRKIGWDVQHVSERGMSHREVTAPAERMGFDRPAPATLAVGTRLVRPARGAGGGTALVAGWRPGCSNRRRYRFGQDRGGVPATADAVVERWRTGSCALCGADEGLDQRSARTSGADLRAHGAQNRGLTPVSRKPGSDPGFS